MPIFRNSNRNTNNSTTPHSTRTSSRAKHQLAASLLSDDGVDSPTYDGDIESSTTAGPDIHSSSKTLSAPSHNRNSSGSTLTSPISAVFPPTSSPAVQTQTQTSPRIGNPDSPPIFISQPVNTSATPLKAREEPAPAAATQKAFNPASLTPEDIQAFVKKAVDGESWRKYKINSPPTDRPIRIYADGKSNVTFPAQYLQVIT